MSKTEKYDFPRDSRELEAIIGYDFKNKEWLREALRHSSYVNEHKGSREMQSNERLEFLGDSVLSVITSEYIFFEYPKNQEGDLTFIRRTVVDGVSLSAFAAEICLGEFLCLGNGERMRGGMNKPTILENAFEALIAAIYIDGGKEAAKNFLLPFIKQDIEQTMNGTNIKMIDPKTFLQQVIQQGDGDRLHYEIVDEYGPEHEKTFVCRVLLNSNEIGRGEGRSKKEAEKEAARKGLEYFGESI